MTVPLCGATAKSTGKPCRREAGWGTDHVGEGRCKLHGGKSLVKHGNRSKVTRQPLREAIAEAEKNPDPLNVLPELAKARGILNLWLDNYEAMEANGTALRAARSAWKAAKRDGDTEAQEAARARVRELEEEQDTLPMAHPDRLLAALDLISKISSRVLQQMNANHVSRKDLGRILQEFARVVNRHVEDEAVKKAIADDFSQVRL